MQNKTPKGFLFDTVAYFSDESIENMINNLDKKSVPYLITQALEYAHSKNVFSLMESEVLSKIVRCNVTTLSQPAALVKVVV